MTMRSALRWVLVLLCCAGAAGAQPVLARSATTMQTAHGSSLASISEAEYGARLTRLQTLVEVCRQRPAECDPAKVGEDVAVQQAGSSFEARWGWLREAFDAAKDAHDANRAEVLRKAAERLAEDAASGATAAAFARVPEARGKIDQILSRAEFRHATPDSAMQRAVAAAMLWLNNLIGGAVERMPDSRWLVPAIEWGSLGLAAAALLVWAWRSSQQQRLAIARPRAEDAAVWQRESDDWAGRARMEAAKGEWREAVHCLYWSAIVLLEGRSAWRQNRARTPREYVALLEAGSVRRGALGALTGIFERIWYGIRPASEGDYERARALLDELRVA
jgi:hypothetical protein